MGCANTHCYVCAMFIRWLCQLWYSHAHVKITKPKLEYQMTAKAAMDVEKIFSSIKTIKVRVHLPFPPPPTCPYLSLVPITYPFSPFPSLQIKSDLTQESWKEYVRTIDALFKVSGCGLVVQV